MTEGNLLLLDHNEVRLITDAGILSSDACLSSASPETKQEYGSMCIVYSTTSGDEIAADPDETTATWLIKARDDIAQLKNLPDNWDSYGSPSIPTRLFENAKNFLTSLEFENISPPRVVPISGGGLQFEWQQGHREIEVEFIEDNFIGYLKVVSDKPIEEGQFSINNYDSARLLIKWLWPRQL
jgi:hypothetical protein